MCLSSGARSQMIARPAWGMTQRTCHAVGGDKAAFQGSLLVFASPLVITIRAPSCCHARTTRWVSTW